MWEWKVWRQNLEKLIPNRVILKSTTTQPSATACGSAAAQCSGLPVWVHGVAWSATILLTLALVGISQRGKDRSPWDGWRESSELRRPAYAERVYPNAIFRTRANTWSNLAYVLVGFYGMALGVHDSRRPSQSATAYLVQTPALSLAFGLACCYLGAGSGLFHASLTRLGQQLDVAAMYAPLLVLIAINAGRFIPNAKFGRQQSRSFPTSPILIALVVVVSMLLFLYKWSMSSTIVLGSLITTVGLLAVLDRLRGSRRMDVRWLAGGCLTLAAAVICRQLDTAGRFTGADAWLQGHALWHILTSLSLGCMYFYYRSEAATPCLARPDRRDNSLCRAVVLAAAFQIISVSVLAGQIAPVQPSKQPRKGPLKVFILAGQSNMQGQGVADLDGKDYNDGKGTLQFLMRDSAKAEICKHLKDDQGRWAVRDDVWVRYQPDDGPVKAGPLTLGFTPYGGQHHFGPELQFGHIMGDYFENQVLLIKTAWGGKSLYEDFRPPSSGGRVGPCYTKMLDEIRVALTNLKSDFPGYDGSGYQIAGFVWYQGWNDGCDPNHAVPEYEQNLVNFIRDVRKDLNAPRLPFVIGELTGPWVEAPGEWATLRKAQAAAASRPEFEGSVLFVETHDFVRKPEDSPNPGHGHHEFGNAETYFLVGDALGKGMKKLLTPARRDEKPASPKPTSNTVRHVES